MRGRVGDDRVADLAGAALAAARSTAAARAVASSPSSVSRVDGQFGDAGDARLVRPQRGRARRAAAGRVGGKLRLELADLAAELAPCGALRCLEPGSSSRPELGGHLRGLSVVVGFVAASGGGSSSGIAGSPAETRATIATSRGSTPALGGGLDRLGGDPLHLGGAAGTLRDEAAAAVTGRNQPSASSRA